MSKQRKKIKLDMHTHCGYSPDSRTPVAVQARAIKAAGLDVVCASDHNTIEGALKLRELASGFRVIIGEEVSSRDGEIIGLFLEEAVPRGLSAEETIARIHGQGGLVCVPHPFSHNRIYHLRRDALERVWPTIDAIEIFNAREALSADNRRAAAFANEHKIPGAVGSDAHRPWELGGAYLECDDFTGRDDFIASVRGGRVEGLLAGHSIHFWTRYDKLIKWLGRRRTKSS